jgi:hypothetical protein
MTSPARAGHPPGPDRDHGPGMPGGRTASLIRMLAAGDRTTHIRSHQETHPKGR